MFLRWCLVRLIVENRKLAATTQSSQMSSTWSSFVSFTVGIFKQNNNVQCSLVLTDQSTNHVLYCITSTMSIIHVQCLSSVSVTLFVFFLDIFSDKSNYQMRISILLFSTVVLNIYEFFDVPVIMNDN